MFSDEHLYAIALKKCTAIGDINFQKLVCVAGSAKEVWNFSKQGLKKSFGIGNKIIEEIGNASHLKFAESEIEFCEKNKIKIRLRHLGELPKLLSECDDAPAILYQKGEFDETLKPISIVGTRNSTSYGKRFIENFIQCLSKNSITVSGLALGTDGEVHEKSLENKIPTIAVLAHGFHTLYPSKHKKLSERIIENGGALLSEFNSSQRPDRENFIRRNRIIAGISSTTIVVETAFGGGSISTATFANMYNRDVFALPGKISDKYSQGCNLLIERNKAGIISSMKELNENLSMGSKEQVGELFPKLELKKQFTENQALIYEFVSENQPISLDEISEKLETPTCKVSPILLELELLGFIKPLSGKKYQIV